jgi:hypothetical protein
MSTRFWALVYSFFQKKVTLFLRKVDEIRNSGGEV